MDSMAYPLFILKYHRGFAIFTVIIVAALQYLVIELMTTLDTQAIYGILLNQLPERFRMLVSENFLMENSIKGAAAFGFNHPIVLALIVMNAINIPARHIAGEIESGTMEWLLAHPIRRSRLLITLWVTGSSLTFLIVCGALAATITALAITHNLTSEILTNMIQISTNLWLLSVMIMSLAFVVSTFGKEGSKVGTRTGALILLFYFLYFMGTLWEFMDVVKPFNIFTYYQPQKLMFGERSFLLHVLVLLALIGISLLISVKQFQRRDIPG